MPKNSQRLVFVPGLGATGEVYEPFLKEMRKRYDVSVAMHSLSMPDTLDREFFFKAIDQAAGDTKTFILIGHSMGGATALAYAARYPDKVTQVIAVSPPTVPDKQKRGQGMAQFRWYRRLQNLALGISSGRPLHALRSLRIRADILADGRRQKLYRWTNGTDLRQDLPKLRHATVFWPKHEKLLPSYHFDEVRKYPNISAKMIPGDHNHLPLNPRRLIEPILKELQ